MSVPAPQEAQGTAIYRAAVCSDGSFYLSDGRGRVVELSAAGQILLDVNGLQEARTVAFTCGAKGELISATPAAISTLKPDGKGHLQTVQSIPTGFLQVAGLAGPDGPPYFLLGMRQPAPEILHVVDQTGRPAHSFGLLPANPTLAQSMSAAFNGTLAWNPITKQTVFLAENPYVFQVFDRNSGLIGNIPRNDPDFQPMAAGVAGAQNLADRVVRGAFLPDGDLVVQVLKRRMTPANHLRTIAYLEIFDSQFRLKATVISTAGLGHFQGIASDGTLYFSLISPKTGIHAIAARLP